MQISYYVEGRRKSLLRVSAKGSCLMKNKTYEKIIRVGRGDRKRPSSRMCMRRSTCKSIWEKATDPFWHELTYYRNFIGFFCADSWC